MMPENSSAKLSSETSVAKCRPKINLQKSVAENVRTEMLPEIISAKTVVGNIRTEMLCRKFM